jgi:uncharacterized membrane protein YccF (DUF307 family)
MRLLLNILWFVFGGWISMLAWMLAGVLLALTILGLPWTAAAFRLASFSAAPFGRQVMPRYAGSTPGSRGGVLDTVLNVVWFVFAGWWLALHHLVLAVTLFVSLIGIPFGLQHLKLAVLSLAPVGTRVVEV